MSAFTLIELMVVIVLIGIVSAMIVPEMRGTFDDMLLRSTGRDLISAFGLASSQAVTLNQLHRVRLDRTGGQYLVERSSRDGPETAGFRPADNVPGAKGGLDRRIRIEIHRPDDNREEGNGDRSSALGDPQSRPGQGEALLFYPDGTAEAGEVLLRDREGFGLALRINPTTARVRVVELERR